LIGDETASYIILGGTALGYVMGAAIGGYLGSKADTPAQKYYLIGGAAIATAVYALITLRFAPHTRAYQPVSPLEQREFEKAKCDVYPDDVRKALAKYQSTVAAWPGIIIESNFQEYEDKVEVVFLFEHHYYDWLEDFSIQREKIFLSPRGEGLFQTSWFLKKDANLSEFKKSASPGNLAIVYGMPEKIEDNIVVLKCNYIRVIDKQWYRMDVLDYGREGEPGEVKKIPLR
jgi:hypothetical protein